MNFSKFKILWTRFKHHVQIRILTNQFISFYKVTFVEEGIDKLDIITISILYHLPLIKEYSKNTDKGQK